MKSCFPRFWCQRGNTTLSCARHPSQASTVPVYEKALVDFDLEVKKKAKDIRNDETGMAKALLDAQRAQVVALIAASKATATQEDIARQGIVQLFAALDADGDCLGRQLQARRLDKIRRFRFYGMENTQQKNKL